MHLAALVLSVAAVIAGRLAMAEPMPHCLSCCLKNATTPCSADSLGEFITCLNNDCPEAFSATSMIMDLMSKRSCRPSVPLGLGWNTKMESSPHFAKLELSSNGACVPSADHFGSFVGYAGSRSDMDDIAQRCTLEIFPTKDCVVAPEPVNLSALIHDSCGYFEGQGVRFQCRSSLNTPDLLGMLERRCGNISSSSADSSTPTSEGTAAGANSTLHLPSSSPHQTPTTTAVLKNYGSLSPNHAKVPASQGLGNNEQAMKPSIAGLVAVVAAAIVMI